ncbi:hypothetical protein D9M72_548300 [compost metagenome]
MPEGGSQLEGLDEVAPDAEDQQTVVATAEREVLDGVVVGLARGSRLFRVRACELGEPMTTAIGAEVGQAAVRGLLDAGGVGGNPART